MKSFLHRLRSITNFRTMRFRPASTFLVLPSLVTIAVGAGVTELLSSILLSRSEEALQEELTAFRGYVRFHDTTGEPYIELDKTDPEEVAEWERLTSVYFVARSNGD